MTEVQYLYISIIITGRRKINQRYEKTIFIFNAISTNRLFYQ